MCFAVGFAVVVFYEIMMFIVLEAFQQWQIQYFRKSNCVLHVKSSMPLGGQISMCYTFKSASTTVKYIMINRRNAEYIKGKNKTPGR